MVETLQSARPPAQAQDYWRDRALRAEQELALIKEIDGVDWTPAERFVYRYILEWIAYGSGHDPDGRTRLNFAQIGEKINLSGSTVGRCFENLAGAGAFDAQSYEEENPDPIARKRKPTVTRWYASSNPDVEKHPARLDLSGIRNKAGGNRYMCPKCGTDKVKVKVRVSVYCPHCNKEWTVKETEHAQESTEQVEATCFQSNPGEIAPENHSKQNEDEVTDSPRPARVESYSEPESPAADPQETFEAAASLLVEIAGDEHLHAEMNQPGKKYGPVRHAFNLEDARAHLSGKSTRAARIRRSDGMTRAICVDADNVQEWARLEDGGQLLHCAGYRPLLEPAPACSLHPGGGHLWIVFEALVDARCAWRHVCEIAPMLAQDLEYWPVSAQNVRLPGGVYVTPEASEQCKLYDALGLVAGKRKEVAAALLAYQTPAAIVPAYPPDPETVKPREKSFIMKDLPTTGDNPTVGELIAAFNASHTLAEVHPPEQGKMARGIWRNEKGRPSVEYHTDTNTAYDYGTRERLDCFDLACLVSGKSKSELLGELRREWNAARLIGKNGQIVSCTDRPEAITPPVNSAQAQAIADEPRAVEANEDAGGGLPALDVLNAAMWTDLEKENPGCVVPASVIATWKAQGRDYVITRAAEEVTREIPQSDESVVTRKVVDFPTGRIVEVA